MKLHSGKNVICVKDIPSNIFEEAIFILKPNVIEEEAEEREEREERNKEIILTEAEDIVEEYIRQMNVEEEETILYEIDNSNNLKWEIFYVVGILMLLAFCISIVI